jgi:hypothetical protein
LQRKNASTILLGGVHAGLVGVIMSAAGCLVEYLEDHLVGVFVEEGE